MKKYHIPLLVISFVCTKALAKEIQNIDSSPIHMGRIAKVLNLVPIKDYKDDTLNHRVLQSHVNARLVFVEVPKGTDLTPTHKMYLGLFKNHEMYHIDVTFDLGYTWSYSQFPEVDIVSDGIYKITSFESNSTSGNTQLHQIIDATQAIDSMKKITCDKNGDKRFDCDAAKNFTSTISVTEEKNHQH